MNITITGKELKATDAIKDYIEEKLARIKKYFADESIDVTVTIKKENVATEIAEMYVSVKGVSYKAVTEDKDLYAAIDKDIDILEGQIRKTKAKREKMMKDSSIKQMNISGVAEEKAVEDEVIKSLSYDIKPISVEDAKLKLSERKGNIFYTFVNVDTGKVNVIFKLKDSNNYGLVEPEA
ncbi:MAG: ribosome-associated translation inhibitor RaiA [Clostridia bacterium]|nr:ribosome-associated translation inhibitor RaiA [Clostridia bacterium]